MQDVTFRKALYKIIHSNAIIDELEGERGEIAEELVLTKVALYIEIEEDIHTLIRNSNYNDETLYLYTFKEKIMLRTHIGSKKNVRNMELY